MALQDTLSRADEVLAERTRRELAKMRAEDAAAEAADRDRVRNDGFKRIEVAQRYADAYRAFGVEPPAPIEGESVGQFRMRLYEGLRRKLPPSNEWADVRADEVPADARTVIEGIIIEAAKAEGLRPSVANLPPDREVVRHRVDENTGAKTTEFFARKSFIKRLSQPGRKVERILDPKRGAVLFGPPLDRFEPQESLRLIETSLMPESYRHHRAGRDGPVVIFVPVPGRCRLAQAGHASEAASLSRIGAMRLGTGARSHRARLRGWRTFSMALLEANRQRAATWMRCAASHGNVAKPSR